jgi:small neutral amino acid transporter SnatA (MarC family)
MERDIPSERTLEWAEPQTRPTPAPTYAPFLLAMGITMMFWGLATSPVMSAGGFVVFVWALWMWIRDIARAWRNQHDHKG